MLIDYNVSSQRELYLVHSISVMANSSTVDFTDLLEKYGELILSLKTRFPRTDLRFLFELMSHEFLNPEHTPTLQLEIFYRPGTDLHTKSKSLESRMDRVPSIFAAENRLVIEPRVTMKDLAELAKDPDIESLAGDVLCCTDALLSRRKHEL